MAVVTTQLERRSVSFRDQALTLVLYALVIVLPVILTTLLLRVQMGAGLDEMTPYFSDEIMLWHEVASFRAAGLNSGYYVVDEITPPASFAHYYAWGVVVPMVYALVSQVAGWSYTALPIYNLAFLSIGIAVYLACVRPKGRRLLLFALVISTSLGLYTHYFSSMRVLLEMGVGIATAGVLYRSLSRPTRANLVLAISVITFGCLLKVTWALCLFPLAYVVVSRRSWRTRAIVLAACVVYSLILYRLWTATAAPYPNALWVVADAFRDSLGKGVLTYINMVGWNLYTFTNGTPLELLQRVLTGVFVASAVLYALKARHRRTHAVTRPMLIGALFIVVGTLLAVLLVYAVHDWREFRMLSPVLLLGLCLLVAAGINGPVLSVIVVTFLALPIVLAGHQMRAESAFHPERSATFHTWQEALAPVIAYEATATSPWCNTVLHTFNYYDEPTLLMALPPGLGLSFNVYNTSTTPVKARWLLVDDGFIRAYTDPTSLEEVLELPQGGLYKNLASACP